MMGGTEEKVLRRRGEVTVSRADERVYKSRGYSIEKEREREEACLGTPDHEFASRCAFYLCPGKEKKEKGEGKRGIFLKNFRGGG